MLRKGNAALTKQVVHVDHAEQAALFVVLSGSSTSMSYMH